MTDFLAGIGNRIQRGAVLCAIGVMVAVTIIPTAAQAQTSRRMGRFDSAVPTAPTPAPPPPVSAMRNTRPLPDLVARVQGAQPYRDMDYIGVERFDSRTSTYVLRFLDGRRVVVVHVDGRTGRVLDR